MTDKQNYFTYTDNTSDNNDKIMENLHKQIIIDGCDVSGCDWYTQGATGMICADWHISNDCCKNPNCYYKKWKRKEQECEELKDLADHNGRVCNERLDKIDELEHAINDLEAENKELKVYKSITPLKVKMLVKTLKEIKEIADKLRHFTNYGSEDDVNADLDKILQKCEVLDEN